jgi:hypothetical protein
LKEEVMGKIQLQQRGLANLRLEEKDIPFLDR